MTTENHIVYETPSKRFWVRDVGKKGYQVMKVQSTHSTVVMHVGHGDAPNLGIARAKAEADKREALS